MPRTLSEALPVGVSWETTATVMGAMQQQLVFSSHTDHEQSTSSQLDSDNEDILSMVTMRTYRLTYSEARAIEVSTWQFVNAVCHNLLPDSWFLSLDSHLFWLQQWGLPVSAC